MPLGDQTLMRSPLRSRLARGRAVPACLLLTYLSFAALFYSAWEIAQIRLYTIWRTAHSGEITYAIVHCTLGDVLIATASMVLAMMLVRDGAPALAFRKTVATATVVGTAYTVFSEWLNVEIRGTWAYTESMPRVPPLGTGLTPLLQWPFITPLAAFAARAVILRVSSRSEVRDDR
jgi:hypothetical protein